MKANLTLTGISFSFFFEKKKHRGRKKTREALISPLTCADFIIICYSPPPKEHLSKHVFGLAFSIFYGYSCYL